MIDRLIDCWFVLFCFVLLCFVLFVFFVLFCFRLFAVIDCQCLKCQDIHTRSFNVASEIRCLEDWFLFGNVTFRGYVELTNFWGIFLYHIEVASKAAESL